MDQLVVVIQRLHEALSALGDASIRLPAIVAVGGQSSGKSSVLESIVGRDFLPRGAGIVTRRPVMMYLHNVPAPPPGAAGDAAAAPAPEFVEFQHRPGQRFHNFDEVKVEIGREMERVAGRNKGMCVAPPRLSARGDAPRPQRSLPSDRKRDRDRHNARVSVSRA